MGYEQTSTPATDHSVWYAYSISIGGVPIGSFERMSVRASRNTERVREILHSTGATPTEILWGGTDISIDLSFVELYTKAVFEALGHPVFSIEDVNAPVDISEVMKLPDDPGGLRVLSYLDCVLSDWSKDLDTGGTKVVESVTYQVRTMVGERTQE